MTTANKKTIPIVTRVSVLGTLKQIPAGDRATFDCRELGSIRSAASAVTRLNQMAGWREFSMYTLDGGRTFTVVRQERSEQPANTPQP